MRKKPNVLLIMADQLNPMHTPLSPEGKAIMPALMSLADRGFVFDRAYCNSPLCAPSRASMMSGQLISSMKCVFDNASEFSCEIPTFAHLFKSAGYRTILSGKMHFIGPDQLHGFDERLTTDIYPADFSWTPPGWDLPSPSHYYYRKILENNGISDWNMQICYDEEVHFRSREKLHELSSSEDPFFMTVSYTHPHSPFKTPERYYNMYNKSEVNLNDTAPPENLDDYNRYLAHDMNYLIPLSEENIVHNRCSYYGMLTYLDDKIGDLVRILEINGMMDNTILIFTSDHGEMLGQKGMWEKRTFLEGSSRIPLLFVGSGIVHGRSSREVSLVDLFPTFINLLGSNWPLEFLDGHSLMPTLSGSDLSDFPAVINEYYGECIKYPFRSAIKDGYKLVHFPSNRNHDIFYDLNCDPAEEHNLIENNSISETRNRLYSAITKDFDYSQLEPIIIKSREQRKLICSLNNSTFKPDWNHHPGSYAASKYVR